MLDASLIIFLGILVGIIFYELTDVSPGGIIVPGMLALYIKQPERIIFTLAISFITYLIIKILSKYLLIYGRRRYVLTIIISIFINFILQLIIKGFSFNLLSLSMIGYIISGIIANDLYKQGIKKTVPALVICVCIVEAIVLIAYQIGA